MVGGVAVIASLIFVGLQVRQSARAQNNAAVDAAINSMMGLNTAIARDPDLTRIVNEASLGHETLDTPEYARFPT